MLYTCRHMIRKSVKRLCRSDKRAVIHCIRHHISFVGQANT
jgi:hypothetical protein